jgi:hypothetical protein
MLGELAEFVILDGGAERVSIGPDFRRHFRWSRGRWTGRRDAAFAVFAASSQDNRCSSRIQYT